MISDSSVNAFAIEFTRKKVIVLLSKTLEGILDKPEQLRFVIGRVLAHNLLDHGARGIFESDKPASYHAAREKTCDNAGLAAARDLEVAKSMLKRPGVGNQLHNRLARRGLPPGGGPLHLLRSHRPAAHAISEIPAAREAARRRHSVRQRRPAVSLTGGRSRPGRKTGRPRRSPAGAVAGLSHLGLSGPRGRGQLGSDDSGRR